MRQVHKLGLLWEGLIIIHTRYIVGLEKTYLLEILFIEIKILTTLNFAGPIYSEHKTRGDVSEQV